MLIRKLNEIVIENEIRYTKENYRSLIENSVAYIYHNSRPDQYTCNTITCRIAQLMLSVDSCILIVQSLFKQEVTKLRFV